MTLVSAPQDTESSLPLTGLTCILKASFLPAFALEHQKKKGGTSPQSVTPIIEKGVGSQTLPCLPLLLYATMYK